jgi:hypothetical protein
MKIPRSFGFRSLFQLRLLRSQCAVARTRSGQARIDSAILVVIGPSVLDDAKLKSKSVVTIDTATRQGVEAGITRPLKCNAGRLQPCAATARKSGATVRMCMPATTSRNSSRCAVSCKTQWRAAVPPKATGSVVQGLRT